MPRLEAVARACPIRRADPAKPRRSLPAAGTADARGAGRGAMRRGNEDRSRYGSWSSGARRGSQGDIPTARCIERLSRVGAIHRMPGQDSRPEAMSGTRRREDPGASDRCRQDPGGSRAGRGHLPGRHPPTGGPGAPGQPSGPHQNRQGPRGRCKRDRPLLRLSPSPRSAQPAARRRRPDRRRLRSGRSSGNEPGPFPVFEGAYPERSTGRVNEGCPRSASPFGAKECRPARRHRVGRPPRRLSVGRSGDAGRVPACRRPGRRSARAGRKTPSGRPEFRYPRPDPHGPANARPRVPIAHEESPGAPSRPLG